MLDRFPIPLEAPLGCWRRWPRTRYHAPSSSHRPRRRCGSIWSRTSGTSTPRHPARCSTAGRPVCSRRCSFSGLTAVAVAGARATRAVIWEVRRRHRQGRGRTSSTAALTLKYVRQARDERLTLWYPLHSQPRSLCRRPFADCLDVGPTEGDCSVSHSALARRLDILGSQPWMCREFFGRSWPQAVGHRLDMGAVRVDGLND